MLLWRDGTSRFGKLRFFFVDRVRSVLGSRVSTALEEAIALSILPERGRQTQLKELRADAVRGKQACCGPTKLAGKPRD